MKMENFKFGVRSLNELAKVHPDLQKVAHQALKVSQVDFGVSDGYRSIQEQRELFTQGKTQRDGIRKVSMHNYTPALAFDIFAYVPGKPQLAFNEKYLLYLGGIITGIGMDLYYKKEISRPIIWGYNWDGDGEIGTDQKFQDMPHFQLGPTINDPI